MPFGVDSHATRGLLSLARDFAAIAADLAAAREAGAVIDRIASHAVARVPGCEAAGVTVVRGRHVVAPAGQPGEVAYDLDVLQQQLGTGPCLSALGDGALVRSDDLAAEARWGTFGAQALAQHGVRSVASYPMQLGSEVVGALNLFSRRAGAFTADGAIEAGGVLAVHAALAVGAANERANLVAAMDSRATIGVAIGVIMGRQGIDQSRAFDVLRRASQRTNVKLREIAVQVAGGRLPDGMLDG